MALIEDEAFLPFVKAYAEDEALFFKDFADAFAALISKGCPAHCQPGAEAPASEATESQEDKDFRDLAMHGSIERMEAIMTAGSPNVNAPEAFSGRTALHKAAYFGHANVVKYLLEKGAGVNTADSDGDTPLHDASRFGHKEIVEALVAGGADKSLINQDGKAATDLAAANEKEEVVGLLA